ncbi:unnamed protein product, partial [Didymodactylos carnosus]
CQSGSLQNCRAGLSIFEPALAALSTIAIDRQANKVVGCRFTADFVDAPGSPPFPDEPEEFKALKGLWLKFDTDWAQTKEQPIRRGQWAHWVGVVVHPDYSNRGIARSLYEHNVNLLKSKGYTGAICENASAFSAKAVEKVGGKLIFVQPYSTYQYNGNFPFQSIPHLHVEFGLREAIF